MRAQPGPDYLGLVSMREQAAMAGGWCRVASTSLRRLAWRAQAGTWVVVIRVVAALVMALGTAASAGIARGW